MGGRGCHLCLCEEMFSAIHSQVQIVGLALKRPIYVDKKNGGRLICFDVVRLTDKNNDNSLDREDERSTFKLYYGRTF